ncbi:hypothetical protein BP6252_13584 [Coleophoma cylindrospora]|uniref:Non-repetitive nucleoporin n=1 Tax=Coleophoma cylindrospora TaxID=1849047 RepID=A0A3D8Q8L1_9HELO|nr:hypothetical protein BP6252_13584 [Coleophoma cylindrospora]
MSYPVLQTPQRFPGAFVSTPAASRFGPPIRQPVFRQQSFGSQPAGAAASGSSLSKSPSQAPASLPAPDTRSSQPVARAARTINKVLQDEANFPDLDSYVRQGTSSDYEVPSPTTEPAWAPFQKTKMYAIPDLIFEQYNRAQVQTMMGLFAELNHAWVTIDNALYLWDYTHPNPELKGFEEQPNSITAVKLVIPKPGVFISQVTHVLVVATTSDIFLLGIEASTGPSGAKEVTLYQTNMQLSIRGIDVRVIAGSAATGRIFFAGSADNEVYELQYQTEEHWFQSRCTKKNHTSAGYGSLVPRVFSQKSPEYVRDMVVDDSRGLVYTLSSESSIRTFHMSDPKSLQLVIEKRRQECLRDISHMTSASPLLSSRMAIVSISPISGNEASKIHLMATTSTGCRLFLSATRGYGWANGQGAPQSMQVQHIKFPPRDPTQPPAAGSYGGTEAAIDSSSQSLSYTRMSLRYPPGFFLCFVTKDPNSGRENLFFSAPDTGRIAASVRDQSAQLIKYHEQAVWLDLESRAEAIGLVTPPFAAGPKPLGFGNELAVQYDDPPTEIAVLTNTGIHTLRRRRLVDIFAAAIRQNGGDEGLDNEIKKFVRQYGRAETTATALAVACGQGSDVTPGDNRAARVMDPETLELARKAFVEHGGKASLNENAVLENGQVPADGVTPSARHAGLAIYMSRLVRSVWKSPVITQGQDKNGAVLISSTIPKEKLKSVQDNLTKLSEFLEKNKTFIEGLTGPESLARATNRHEETALQGEHQALHSLTSLNSSIIEGISFVLMLFDERVDEIWHNLDDTTKQRLRNLTFETLFSEDTGKDLAKQLVKSIVNRNIAKDSNVTQVAEALRRRCGTFCSADDVIIFKSQELLKQAHEAGGVTDQARNLLNESLRLFQSVAGALSFENLGNAVDHYIDMQFYAGAITLALDVARESDRGNKALGWVNEGKPDGDARASAFVKRKEIYDLIHEVLQTVDQMTSRGPETIDGRFTLLATKRNEAYAVVHQSRDELFQFDLYDWYLAQGWTDRLLAIDSDYVEPYLQRIAATDVEKADLLWRFYAGQEDYYKAAQVQLELAKSDFKIPLTKRINYLSNARNFASAQSAGIGRQARQMLLHEVSELLEVANIQDELLHRLRGEERLTADRKEELVKALDGQIIGLTELYNSYADSASYFDICLMIYQAADHRSDADIMSTWQNILDVEHTKVAEDPEASQLPYEAVINVVCDLGNRLNFSETTFSPLILIPLLEKYAFECQRDVGPKTWLVDLFLRIRFPHEIILSTLTTMFYNDEAPFAGRNRRVLAEHILYIIQEWYRDCRTNNSRMFNGEENAREIDHLLVELIQNGNLSIEQQQQSQEIRRSIELEF